MGATMMDDITSFGVLICCNGVVVVVCKKWDMADVGFWKKIMNIEGFYNGNVWLYGKNKQTTKQNPAEQKVGTTIDPMLALVQFSPGWHLLTFVFELFKWCQAALNRW